MVILHLILYLILCLFVVVMCVFVVVFYLILCLFVAVVCGVFLSRSASLFGRFASYFVSLW